MVVVKNAPLAAGAFFVFALIKSHSLHPATVSGAFLHRLHPKQAIVRDFPALQFGRVPIQ
jgi:hypothetical protein